MKNGVPWGVEGLFVIVFIGYIKSRKAGKIDSAKGVTKLVTTRPTVLLQTYSCLIVLGMLLITLANFVKNEPPGALCPEAYRQCGK